MYLLRAVQLAIIRYIDSLCLDNKGDALQDIPIFSNTTDDRYNRCIFQTGGRLCGHIISSADLEKAAMIRSSISTYVPREDDGCLERMLHDLTRLCKCKALHRNIPGYRITAPGSQDASISQTDSGVVQTDERAESIYVQPWIALLKRLYKHYCRQDKIEAMLVGSFMSIGGFFPSETLPDTLEAVLCLPEAYSALFYPVARAIDHLEPSGITAITAVPPRQESSMMKDIVKALMSSETESGYIYIFTKGPLPEDPPVASNELICADLVKIGTTNEVSTRMDSIRRKCKFQPLQICEPRYVENAKRVEKLIHAELQIRGLKRKVRCCPNCKVEHREWFETSTEEAQKVMNHWCDWMTVHKPYSDSGHFQQQALVWNAHRLHNTEIQHSTAPSSPPRFEMNSTGSIWFDVNAPMSSPAHTAVATFDSTIEAYTDTDTTATATTHTPLGSRGSATPASNHLTVPKSRARRVSDSALLSAPSSETLSARRRSAGPAMR